jgi:hypothetical protein
VRAVLGIAHEPSRRRRAVVMNAAVVNAGACMTHEHRYRRAIFVAPLLAVLYAGTADRSFPLTDPEPDALTIHDMTWAAMDGFLDGSTRLPFEAAVDHILRFSLPALGALAEPGARRATGSRR